MIIQCRRSSAWESTRPFWGEAEDRAVVSSNLTDGTFGFQLHNYENKNLTKSVIRLNPVNQSFISI